MGSLLRFPRPRSFLHFVSLRTAAEFITLTLAINKITGLYGVLALFTGYTLDALQFSHYIYSLLVLGLAAYLSSSIRTRDNVLQNVALAWLYVLDTLINGIYTALFGMGWFTILAEHLNDDVKSHRPGKGMMEDTAGFTGPVVNASSVDVIAEPASGSLVGQDATAYAIPGSLGAAIFQSGSIASIAILVFLVLIRVYMSIVMLSFARNSVRASIATASASTAGDFSYSDSTSGSNPSDPTMAASPFEQTPGWRGNLGRAMLRLPTERYWLGRDEAEDAWVRATSGRFSEGRRALKISVPVNQGSGVGERERRARSGTGPPVPAAGLTGKIPQ
ncbi:DUF1753-domain-containing protein [Acrodontium crateriforme]|uniref:DUF1753-domain-containing protein n=1 Tax=Acrodontium crateriforme TaxID=150365 RepID=A0AAQ3MBP4_9PEZI|nr:DUF1753-domain-containing protein [Acrodontium crateriforme]